MSAVAFGLPVRRYRLTRAVGAAACAILLVGLAHAETGDGAARAAPRPHITTLSGAVSVQAGGQGQWLAAVSERALATGDGVWTQPGGHAALALGAAAAELAEQTQVTLVGLDNGDTVLRLVQGSLVLSVPALGRGEAYQIETPRGVMRVMQPGRFAVDAGAGETPTRVTAHDGTAQIVGSESGLIVHTGQTGVITGVDGGISYAVQQAELPAAAKSEAAATPAADTAAAQPDAPEATVDAPK